MKPGRRLVVVLLASNLGLFLMMFAIAVFRHSGSSIIPLLSLKWELATATLDFIRWLAPLQFFAATLTATTLKGDIDGIVAKLTVPVVTISAILSASALILAPVMESNSAVSLAASSRFNQALTSLGTALNSEDANGARMALDIIVAIDRGDPRLIEPSKRLDNLELKESRAKATEQASAENEAPSALGGRRQADLEGAKAAWKSANEFYGKGDWYNAHWQATLAFRLDPTLVDAKRLAALAWEELSRTIGETPGDREKMAFYEKKLEGYGLLRSEDFVGAWRIFVALDKDHRDDIEVRRYLAESLAGIERTAFFRDEADSASVDSSLPRLFFRYKAKGGERIFAARETSFAVGAAYLFDFEYAETRGDGSVLIIRSPWAKLSGNRLFLVAAERNRPGLSFRATATEIPAGTSAPEAGRSVRAPASIEAGIDVEELYELASARNSPSSLRVLEAWKTLDKAASFGIDPEPLLLEMLRRLGLPFGIFGAAALGTLIGLRFRAPSDGRRGFPLVSLPFMGAITVIAFLFLSRLDLLASTWAARFSPNLNALWLSAGMRSAFILATVLLAVGASRVQGPIAEKDAE
jgi:hypothetical protein